MGGNKIGNKIPKPADCVRQEPFCYPSYAPASLRKGQQAPFPSVSTHGNLANLVDHPPAPEQAIGNYNATRPGAIGAMQTSLPPASLSSPEQRLARCWPDPPQDDVVEERRKVAREQRWQEVQHQAQADGVLKSFEHPDGNWYVELGPGRLKRVQYDFWCPHCDAHLSEHSLGDHLDGNQHKKRMSSGPASKLLPMDDDTKRNMALDILRPLEPWQERMQDGEIKCLACNKFCDGYHENSGDHERKLAWYMSNIGVLQQRSTVVRTCMPCSGSSSSSAARPAPNLEEWQEMDQEGNIKCLPCNKFCDGCHECCDEHIKKLERWLAARREDTYSAPPQLWLAWVPCQGWGENKRYLKCLICSKWVMDVEHPSEVTAGYDGSHGTFNSVKNQRDHAKKVENLQEYMKDREWWSKIIQERDKWHPGAARPLAIDDAAPQQTSMQVLDEQPSEPSDPLRGPVVPLGWRALWSEEYEAWYYSNGVDPAQWELPKQCVNQNLLQSGSTTCESQNKEQARRESVLARAQAAQAVKRPAAPSLPEGWEATWSSEDAEYYFVHLATGKAQWELPQVEQRRSLQRPSAPAGWISMWSSEYSAYYYMNEATRSTQWEYPRQGQPTGTASREEQNIEC